MVRVMVMVRIRVMVRVRARVGLRVGPVSGSPATAASLVRGPRLHPRRVETSMPAAITQSDMAGVAREGVEASRTYMRAVRRAPRENTGDLGVGVEGWE